MNTEDVKQRIAELAAIRPDPGDDEVALVEAALFVEEVFGLRLTDEDMTAERLGTRNAMEQLVLQRLEVE